MLRIVARLTNSVAFQNVIFGIIVLNAVLLGFETEPAFREAYRSELYLTHSAIAIIFILELGLRILATAPRFSTFFKDGWNIFDFVIVVASILPASGQFATVARLVRVLRLLRLVTISKELRLIVGTMLRSIPSMGHVIALLSILLYVYAIIGNSLFASIDPESWGSLKLSLLTLFQILTLEGWIELQQRALPTYPYAWIFFISFIVIAVFVVVNLFIAVVTNNLQSVKAEEDGTKDEASPASSIESQLEQIRAELSRIRSDSKT